MNGPDAVNLESLVLNLMKRSSNIQIFANKLKALFAKAYSNGLQPKILLKHLICKYSIIKILCKQQNCK